MGKWSILTLTICLLIGWNYWTPFFFSSASFTLAGRPSLDFQGFYYYGKAWLAQENPYPMSGRPIVFLSPPTFFPFFGVFALFDFSFASRLWMIASFSAFLVALVALALTLEGDRRYVYVSIAGLLFLTSHPLFLLFQLGQNELLVASFAILSLVSERMKHLFPSAILLSFATLLKGPAGLVLIYFVIFHRDLSYLARFLVSSLVIVGASLLIVPLRLYADYGATFLTDLSTSFASNWIQFMTELACIGGLVSFAIFSYWVSSKKLGFEEAAIRSDAMFVLNVLVMLLLGSGFAIYSYVWIILPLALFLSSLIVKEVRIRYYLVIGFATCLLNSILSTSLINYRVEFPFAVVGNLVLTIVLIAISIHPIIIRKANGIIGVAEHQNDEQ